MTLLNQTIDQEFVAFTIVIISIRFLRVLRYNKQLGGIEFIYRVIKSNVYNLMTALFLLLTAIVIGATVFYLVEGPGQPDNFGSIPRSICIY
jgi:voltage-gated potassium channel